MKVDPNFQKWMNLRLSKKKSKNNYTIVKRLFKVLNLQQSDFQSQYNLNRKVKNYLQRNVNLFQLNVFDDRQSNKEFIIDETTTFIKSSTIKDEMYALLHYLNYIEFPTELFSETIRSIPRRARIQEENMLFYTLFNVNETIYILNQTTYILMREQYDLDKYITTVLNGGVLEYKFKVRLRNFLEICIRLFVHPFPLIQAEGRQKLQDMEYHNKVIRLNRYGYIDTNEEVIKKVRENLVVCVDSNKNVSILSCVIPKKTGVKKKTKCGVNLIVLPEPISYYMYFYLKYCRDANSKKFAFLNNTERWNKLTTHVFQYLQDLQVPIPNLNASNYGEVMKYYWLCYKLYNDKNSWLDPNMVRKLAYTADLSLAKQSHTDFYNGLSQFASMIPALEFFNRYPKLNYRLLALAHANPELEKSIRKQIDTEVDSKNAEIKSEDSKDKSEYKSGDETGGETEDETEESEDETEEEDETETGEIGEGNGKESDITE